MEELLQEFIAETSETMDQLASELVIWENDPTDKERLDNIFRFFHTVKGSCGFLNLDRFEKLSHAAEDVLSELRAGKREASADLVDAILAIIDKIGELTAILDSGEECPEGDDSALINALYDNGTPLDDEILPAKAEAEADDDDGSDFVLNPFLTAHKKPEETTKQEPEKETAEDNRESGSDSDCTEDEENSSPTKTPALRQKSAGRSSAPVRSIRIPLELIDHMMSGISDMVLARNEVARNLREQTSNPAMENAFERLSTCIADMRDAIGQTRMQRINRIFSPLPRIVRDLAHDLGKEVELRTSGNNVELDREMIEMIRDPLTHIIRNSIDHGIECPAERVQKGKPETGKLSISARQSGNQILIEITDDGQGINVEKLVNKAIANKLKTNAEVQAMSDKAKLDLIFSAGVSTAKEVTSISGRGVGMDVVRSNIERIGGSIDLENNEGYGLKVVLRVPLTLTIIPCLTVKAGGQYFAMPRSTIREILFDNNDQVRLETVGGASIAYIRGQCMPHIMLENVLQMDMENPQTIVDNPHEINASRSNKSRTLVTITASSELQYALNVEAVIDHEELVVRPGAPIIMADGLYAGTTLPDNGRPMLLLDPMGLGLRAGLSENPENNIIAEEQSADSDFDLDNEESALLYRDTHNRVRAVSLGIVERVEDVDPMRIDDINGKIRMEIEGESRPVHGLYDMPHHSVQVLHMTDGENHIHYAIEEIIDIIKLPQIDQINTADSEVMGVALIGGRQIEVIDTHYIFSEHATSKRRLPPEQAPKCCITGPADQWTRNILAPLIRSAGYELIFHDDSHMDEPKSNLSGAQPSLAKADIYVTSEETPLDDQHVDAPIIRLSNEPHIGHGDNDGAIYRYDRMALINALQAGLSKRKAS